MALSPAERSYILAGLSHPSVPSRLDGRPLVPSSGYGAFRSIQLARGDAPQASGSARVLLDEGGTEVVAGVELEVVDAVPGEARGKESWRASVEVDLTPSAYPNFAQSSSSSATTSSSLPGQSLSALSTYYTNLIADHFVPYLPPLPIVEGYKYFQPRIHVSILAASSAGVVAAIFYALRTAFVDLRIPRTKQVGWESVAGPTGGGVSVDAGMGIGAAAPGSGMKAAMSGRAKGKGRVRTEKVGPGEDWELVQVAAAKPKRGRRDAMQVDAGGDDKDDGNEDGKRLPASVRRGLPICITLNLIPEPSLNAFFIDATSTEEIACPSRLHAVFCARTESGKQRTKICGTRIEGGQGVQIDKLPGLLQQAETIAVGLMCELNEAAETADENVDTDAA